MASSSEAVDIPVETGDGKIDESASDVASRALRRRRPAPPPPVNNPPIAKVSPLSIGADGTRSTGLTGAPLTPPTPDVNIPLSPRTKSSKDQLDNISGLSEHEARRRSSSSSSVRSRRCSGESVNAVREITKLASIKEVQKGLTSADAKGRDEFESLISAKLAQCRVIFDFSCDPLSDLKFKVCIVYMISIQFPLIGKQEVKRAALHELIEFVQTNGAVSNAAQNSKNKTDAEGNKDGGQDQSASLTPEFEQIFYEEMVNTVSMMRAWD